MAGFNPVGQQSEASGVGFRNAPPQTQGVGDGFGALVGDALNALHDVKEKENKRAETASLLDAEKTIGSFFDELVAEGVPKADLNNLSDVVEAGKQGTRSASEVQARLIALEREIITRHPGQIDQIKKFTRGLLGKSPEQGYLDSREAELARQQKYIQDRIKEAASDGQVVRDANLNVDIGQTIMRHERWKAARADHKEALERRTNRDDARTERGRAAVQNVRSTFQRYAFQEMSPDLNTINSGAFDRFSDAQKAAMMESALGDVRNFRLNEINKIRSNPNFIEEEITKLEEMVAKTVDPVIDALVNKDYGLLKTYARRAQNLEEIQHYEAQEIFGRSNEVRKMMGDLGFQSVILDDRNLFLRLRDQAGKYIGGFDDLVGVLGSGGDPDREMSQAGIENGAMDAIDLLNKLPGDQKLEADTVRLSMQAAEYIYDKMLESPTDRNKFINTYSKPAVMFSVKGMAMSAGQEAASERIAPVAKNFRRIERTLTEEMKALEKNNGEFYFFFRDDGTVSLREDTTRFGNSGTAGGDGNQRPRVISHKEGITAGRSRGHKDAEKLLKKYTTVSNARKFYERLAGNAAAEERDVSPAATTPTPKDDEEKLRSPFDDAVSSVPDDNSAAATQLLTEFEGYISKAEYDVNAWRVGYGSDTVTREDGTVEKVTKDTVITRADAERDLQRRIPEFQEVVKKQIGEDTFNELNPQQQAVLTSLAYNYGNLRSSVVRAIATGDDTKVAEAIRALKTHNKGINKRRREREAALYEQQHLAASRGTEQENEGD